MDAMRGIFIGILISAVIWLIIIVAIAKATPRHHRPCPDLVTICVDSGRPGESSTRTKSIVIQSSSYTYIRVHAKPRR